MATYVDAPNGKRYRVNAPPGTPPDVIKQAFQKQHPEAMRRPAEGDEPQRQAIEQAPQGPPQKNATDRIFGSAAGLMDLPIGFAASVLDTGRSVLDAVGTDNEWSGNLRRGAQYLRDQKSQGEREEKIIREKRSADAEGKGFLAETGAVASNLLQSPLDYGAEAMGSVVPFVAAAAAAPEAGLFALLAREGLGVAAGAGAVKGAIYDAVKAEALKTGKVTEEQAEAMAVEAQEYDGENLDMILLGGGMGLIASKVGVEAAVGKYVASKAAQRVAAKLAGERGAQLVAEGAEKFAASKVGSATGEAVTEYMQGGQEQIAANLAEQREGYDTPLMEGVYGAAALEGAMGGIAGGATDTVLEGFAQRAQRKEDEGEPSGAPAVGADLEFKSPEEEAAYHAAFRRFHNEYELSSSAAEDAAWAVIQSGRRARGETDDTGSTSDAPDAAGGDGSVPPVGGEAEPVATVGAAEVPDGGGVGGPSGTAGTPDGGTGASQSPLTVDSFLNDALAGKPSRSPEHIQFFMNNRDAIEARYKEILDSMERFSSPAPVGAPEAGLGAPASEPTPVETPVTPPSPSAQPPAAAPAPEALPVDEPMPETPEVASAPEVEMPALPPVVQNNRSKENRDIANAHVQDAAELFTKHGIAPPKKALDRAALELIKNPEADVVDLLTAALPKKLQDKLEEVIASLSAESAPDPAVLETADALASEPEQAAPEVPPELAPEPTPTEATIQPEIASEPRPAAPPADVVPGTATPEFEDVPEFSPEELALFEQYQQEQQGAQPVQEAAEEEDDLAGVPAEFLAGVDAYEAEQAQPVQEPGVTYLPAAAARNADTSTKKLEPKKPRTRGVQGKQQGAAEKGAKRITRPVRAQRVLEADLERAHADRHISSREYSAAKDTLRPPTSEADLRSRPLAENAVWTQLLKAQAAVNAAEEEVGKATGIAKAKARTSLRGAKEHLDAVHTHLVDLAREKMAGGMAKRAGTKEKLLKLLDNPSIGPSLRRELRIQLAENKVSRYFLPEGQVGVGIDADVAEDAVSRITKGWKSKFPIKVAQSHSDLPARVRAGLASDKAMHAQGFVAPDGTVYIIADNIGSEAEVAGILYHEALGHLGLDALFHKRLDSVLQSMYDTNKDLRAETDAWLKKHPDAYSDSGSRTLRAVEEVLANRAMGGKLEASLLQRLATVLKDFARRLGINLDFTNAEVMAVLARSHSKIVDGDYTSRTIAGMRYIFAGERSKHNEDTALAEAKRLAQGNANTGSNSPLHRMTGWFKAPDGKWRFEISDARSGLSPHWDNAQQSSEYGEPEHVYRLGDALMHSKLYQLYPTARNIGVVIRPLPEGTDGVYDHDNNRIEISPNTRDVHSILLHEVQHWVQHQEGFAYGGDQITGLELMSTNELRRARAETLQRMTEVKTVRKQELALAEEAFSSPEFNALERAQRKLLNAQDAFTDDVSNTKKGEAFHAAQDVVEKAFDALTMKFFGKPYDEVEGTEEAFAHTLYRAASDYEPEEHPASILSQLRELLAEVSHAQRKLYLSVTRGALEANLQGTQAAHEAYEALFGEVEARAVQNRRWTEQDQLRYADAYTGTGTKPSAYKFHTIPQGKALSKSKPNTDPKDAAKIQRKRKQAVSGAAKVAASADLEADVNATIENAFEDSIKSRDGTSWAGAIASNTPLLSNVRLKHWLKAMTSSMITEVYSRKFAPLRAISEVESAFDGERTSLLQGLTKYTDKLAKWVRKHGQLMLGNAMHINRLNRVSADLLDAASTVEEVYANDKVVKLYEDKAAAAKDAKAKTKAESKIKLRKSRIKESWDAWQELKKQPGGTEQYFSVRQFHHDMAIARRARLTAELDALDVPAEVKKSLIANLQLEHEKVGNMEAPSPLDADDDFPDVPLWMFPPEYFPFKRYGDYYFKIKKHPVTGPQTLFFESAKERDAELKKRAAEMGKDWQDASLFSMGDSVEHMREDFHSESSVMQKVMNIIDNYKGSDKNTLKGMERDIYEVFILASPAAGFRKQFIKSQNRTGFSGDILRNTVESAKDYAHELPKIKYRPLIDRAISQAHAALEVRPGEGDVDEAELSPEEMKLTTESVAKMRSVIEELGERARQSLAPPQLSPWVTRINRMAFVWMLTSAATAATQFSSLPIRVFPRLTREYGGAKAMAKMAAYAPVWKSVGISQRNEDGTLTWTGPSVRSSSRVRKSPVLRRAYDVGKTEFSMFKTASSALLQAGKNPNKNQLSRLGRATEAFVNLTSAMFNTAERISQEMAYMMTFELEYAKTRDFDASVRKAVQVVHNTIGNYNEFNRPSLLRGDIARAGFLFKQYPLLQTEFFVGNTIAAINPKNGFTVKERLKSAQEIGNVLMMGGLSHGLVGMPLYSIIALGVNLALRGLEDDDDEDYQKRLAHNPATADDSDFRFRYDFLRNVFGDEKIISGLDGRKHSLADILTYGPVSELSDTNIGSRTSFDGMWFRDARGNPEGWADYAFSLLESNIPGASVNLNLLKGAENIYKGNVIRGLEQMLPASLRGFATATRMVREGVRTWNKDVMVPDPNVSGYDIALAGAGYQSTELAKASQRSATVRKLTEKIEKEKSSLLSRLNDLRDDPNADVGALEKAEQAIRDYNNKYRNTILAIDGKDVKDSYTSRTSKTKWDVLGTHTNKELFPYFIEDVQGK